MIFDRGMRLLSDFGPTRMDFGPTLTSLRVAPERNRVLNFHDIPLGISAHSSERLSPFA
jgi:hypothetical protein